MQVSRVDEQDKVLAVKIPLTNGTGKTRIKKRSFFNQYGLPVPTKTEAFSQNCYVEWQIGYDVLISDIEKLRLTTLKDKLFTGANGKTKTLYELSEYIYYFHQWDIVRQRDLLAVQDFLDQLTNADFIDNPNNFAIERTDPVERNLCGIHFAYTQVKYPMLIHRFGKYEILTEIKITEKQYAIGVQPMLYFCFPVTELIAESPLISRTAKTKEAAEFIIDKNNIVIFLEMLRIFGMLSSAHNHDIRQIIRKILA